MSNQTVKFVTWLALFLSIFQLTMVSYNVVPQVCFKTNYLLQTIKPGVQVKLRSFKCEKNPEFFTSHTCVMVPTSDRLNNLTIRANIRKNIHDAWIHFAAYFFYQGSYRRFLVDFDWDYCGHFSGSVTSFLLARAIKTVNLHFPGLVHPCPYGPSDGSVGVTNQSPTLVLNGVIPRAIPDGLYKLKARVHNKANVTLLMVEATGNLTVLQKLKIDPSKLLAGLL